MEKGGLMKSTLLIIAGVFSCLVGLLHIVIIFLGADGYRYFGAGEEMAKLAQSGSLVPALVTFILAGIFVVLGLYAFSGAGLIPRLPLLRIGLLVIAAVYTLRGLFLLPQIYLAITGKFFFFREFLFSGVSLLIGIFYFTGLRARWKEL